MIANPSSASKRHDAPDCATQAQGTRSAQPRVSVVVLNWNGWRDTLACVTSLEAMHYPNFDIVIVDNGSTDGSEKLLRQHAPGHPVLQTGENLGFAGGNNVGIDFALSRGVDLVWLLNNDTEVVPSALSQLVELLTSTRNGGAATCGITYATPPDSVWFWGGRFSSLFRIPVHRGHRCPSHAPRLMDMTTEIDFATGCSILVRVDVIRRVGMLPTHYFMYYEDVDWSLRIREAGYKIVMVLRPLVVHKVAASSEGLSPRVYYYDIRNGLWFSRQRFRRLPRILAIVGRICRVGEHGLRILLRREGALHEKVRFMFAAIRDGFGPIPGESS